MCERMVRSRLIDRENMPRRANLVSTFIYLKLRHYLARPLISAKNDWPRGSGVLFYQEAERIRERM